MIRQCLIIFVTALSLIAFGFFLAMSTVERWY